MNVNAILRSMGQKIGLEVRRTSTSSREDLRLVHQLVAHDINLIIDVGANLGQFAAETFAAGYRGRILSIEALPDVHASLSRRASAERGDRWTVADPQALAAEAGVAVFHRTASHAASSLLKPAANMIDQIPAISGASTISVACSRLDDVMERHGLANTPSFIKIDVQGGELGVLSGGPRALALARGVLVEVSTVKIYEGQPLFDDVYALLRQQGFKMWDVFPGHRNAKTTRMEQFDLVMFRP